MDPEDIESHKLSYIILWRVKDPRSALALVRDLELSMSSDLEKRFIEKIEAEGRD
jgi:hypothetical protein